MKISVIGTGYVGLTAAVGLASKGHEVIGVEKRQETLERIKKGECPIFEKGLPELLKKVLAEGRLSMTGDLEAAVLGSEISMICVGTPSREDGSIDLSAVKDAAFGIGKALKKKSGFHIIVVKSTVLPGTTLETVGSAVATESSKKAGADFGLAMVPEFLREGSALCDFLEPDRIVIGAEDERTGKALSSLFSGSFSAPVILTNTKTAEMIKYANNSFLALCISFANEIAQICEKTGGTDAYEVLGAVAQDGRITTYQKDGRSAVPEISKYLIPGCGFGGSCLPKDLSAILSYERKLGIKESLVEKTMQINKLQVASVAQRAQEMLGSLEGREVAVLGASFKPNTDDTRQSPSIEIISGLLSKGAKVRAYDPLALEGIKRIFGSKIDYTASAADAIRGCELAIVATAWKEFRQLSPEDFISLMKKARVLDCRGIYERRLFSSRLEYCRTGYKN